MARMIFSASVIISMVLLTGCVEEFNVHQLPERTEPEVRPQAASTALVSSELEIDLIEKVIEQRRKYQGALEDLGNYYNDIGNNMKLTWVTKELEELNVIPQYRYMLEAEVAGTGLSASEEIEQADVLYRSAMKDYKKAKALVVVVNKKHMRMSLDKFSQLIRRYPTSDKIDDAAYRSAEIYEHFKDYAIAVLYYQRTYQWNPETGYPARFKAANLLDKKLRERVEALQLYKLSLQKETKHPQYNLITKDRIEELTKTRFKPLPKPEIETKEAQN